MATFVGDTTARPAFGLLLLLLLGSAFLGVIATRTINGFVVGADHLGAA